MHGKYILIALVVFLFLTGPADAGTKKVAANSPVFIGETDIDISSGLKGCNEMGWWPDGADLSSPPVVNLSLFPINTVSPVIYHFNVSPAIFAGHTGTWCCGNKKPYEPVMVVYEPEIDIRVWDLDHDQDVTGKTLPLTANVTYRIDTNMYPAFSYLNRPDLNPSDSFMTVVLTDPQGRKISNIYTGNAGARTTQIIPFDATPFVSASPYYWKNGNAWDLAARNVQGELISPPGTYTFSLSQNLNAIRDSYTRSGITDIDGVVTKSATVTFEEPVRTTTLTTVHTVVTATTGISPPTPLPQSSKPPKVSPVPKKTTYASLSVIVVLIGIGLACFYALAKNN